MDRRPVNERKPNANHLAAPETRRGRLPTITPAGRALLSKAFPIWKQAHAAAERLLTGCSANDLRSALRALS